MTVKRLHLAHSALMAAICAVSIFWSGGASASPAQNRIQADVQAACELVATRYAYIDELTMDLGTFCEDLTADAAGRSDLLPVLEELVAALRDNHVSLNTNSSTSPRLAPSGADYAVRPSGEGLAVVTGVRPASSAALAGLMPGDQIVAIDGRPVDDIISAWEAYESEDQQVSRDMSALNQAAAGQRGAPRSVTLKTSEDVSELQLDDPVQRPYHGPVTALILPGEVLYVRFNNSLGESDTVAAFEAAIEDHADTHRWIIDLRDTPSGGGTDVAEPILGRFVDERANYQRFSIADGSYVDRYVDPRGPWTISGDVIVLVGNWTGSMGEGMAVGFDALGIGDVVGSQMAALRGGIEGLNLPSGLVLRLPTYDLTHVDGTPRHDWMPPYEQIADNGNGPDIALAQAIWMLTLEED